MAAKNPDLVSLPDHMKTALKLLNSKFPLEFDGVIVTKGLDAINLRDTNLKQMEVEYYEQNLPRRLLTIAEREALDKQDKATAIATAKEVRNAEREKASERAKKAQLNQASLSF